MKKPRSKRTVEDRVAYLAKKKIKDEIRARPPQQIPEEYRGVTLRERDSYQSGDLTGALLLMASLMARRRMKRAQDFWGPVKRKELT